MHLFNLWNRIWRFKFLSSFFLLPRRLYEVRMSTFVTVYSAFVVDEIVEWIKEATLGWITKRERKGNLMKSYSHQKFSSHLYVKPEENARTWKQKCCDRRASSSRRAFVVVDSTGYDRVGIDGLEMRDLSSTMKAIVDYLIPYWTKRWNYREEGKSRPAYKPSI